MSKEDTVTYCDLIKLWELRKRGNVCWINSDEHIPFGYIRAQVTTTTVGCVSLNHISCAAGICGFEVFTALNTKIYQFLNLKSVRFLVFHARFERTWGSQLLGIAERTVTLLYFSV
jgi:hypothetical protein